MSHIYTNTKDAVKLPSCVEPSLSTRTTRAAVEKIRLALDGLTVAIAHLQESHERHRLMMIGDERRDYEVNWHRPAQLLCDAHYWSANECGEDLLTDDELSSIMRIRIWVEEYNGLSPSVELMREVDDLLLRYAVAIDVGADQVADHEPDSYKAMSRLIKAAQKGGAE
jgi:hypothetical protein